MTTQPSTYRRAGQPWSLPTFGNLEIAWFLLLLGTLSFTDASAAVALSGQLNSSNVVRYVCVLLALLLIVPELRSPIRISLNPLWLFAAYAVICIVSTLWSVSPIVTLGKAVELTAATATIVFAANRSPDGRTLTALFNVTFMFGAAMLVFAAGGYFLGFAGFSVPSKGLISQQLDTWFLSGNGVGYVSALTATVALDAIVRRSSGWLAFAGLYTLSLATAVLAQGRTGLFAFILGTLLVLTIRRRMIALLAVCVVLLVVAVAFGQTVEAYLVRGEQAENLQTLSGRSTMWQAAWQSFLAHPLAGTGFGVGGRSLFLTSLAGFGVQVSSLHNGVLELLTGVGLLGFVPWVSSFAWTLLNTFRSSVAGRNVAVCAVMAPLLATTAMSTGAGGWLDLSLAYFLCVTAILAHGAAEGARRSATAQRFR